MSDVGNSTHASKWSPIFSESDYLLQPNFDSDEEDDSEDISGGSVLIGKKRVRLPPFLSPPAWEHFLRTKKVTSVSAAVDSWIEGEKLVEDDSCESCFYYAAHRSSMKTFKERRRNVHAIAAEPGSYLDDYMRLVSRESEEIGEGEGAEEENGGGAQRQGRENVPQDHGGRDFVVPFRGFFGIDEEEERRLEEVEEREIIESIDRAVKKYRDDGVPEDEFEFISEPLRDDARYSLLFRRIFFAVFAVLTGFLCIMSQAFPSLGTSEKTDTGWKLDDLMDVQTLETYVQKCGKPNETRPGKITKYECLLPSRTTLKQKADCINGVIHVPSIPSLGHPFNEGVNITWIHRCKLPSILDHTPSCFPSMECFRGIHDGYISSEEVDSLLLLASKLINKGGNHIDVRRDVLELKKYVPSVPMKLEKLLRTEYEIDFMHPVAFRISSVLPVNVDSWNYNGKTPLLLYSINKTSLISWEKSFHLEDVGSPWPPILAPRAFRDPCTAMSDLEASSDFVFHTSVFLSDEGEDFTGGSNLYVDDHRRNANPRARIRRGVAVDASRGRIVVSTGGDENKRCRLPTKTGIKAVLQVWWGCGDDTISH